MLDRDGIITCIPHTGKMCLLDRVIEWNDRSIRCTARSHRDLDNPLREMNGLPVWAGIEYAAQAAAVHGALIQAPQTPEILWAPRAGVLAALRDVDAMCDWLDRINAELQLGATLMHADAAGGIYRFDVRGDGDLLLSGQFTLMFPNQKRKGLA